MAGKRATLTDRDRYWLGQQASWEKSGLSAKEYARKHKLSIHGFYQARKRRGPAVLTPTVLAEAQTLLDEGLEPSEVADQLGIKRDTFSKAVRAGRVHKPAKKTLPHS